MENKDQCAEPCGSKIRKGSDLSSLHIAAKNGDLSTTKMLIETAELSFSSNENILKFVCPLITKDDIGTPLSLAASEGHWEIVDVLSRLYSNSSAEETGYALYEACKSKQVECVKILVRLFPHHVNSAHGKSGFSPIHLAAEENELNVMKALLQAGANANSKLKDGRTALYFATLHGCKDIVQILLRYGADPCCSVTFPREFYSEKNPLAIAAEMGHLGVVDILSEVTPKNLGQSAIFHSAHNKKHDCLKFLLENGFASSLSNDERFWDCLLPGIYVEYHEDLAETAEILLDHEICFKSLARPRHSSLRCYIGHTLVRSGCCVLPLLFKRLHINILRTFLTHGLLELRYSCNPFPNTESAREPWHLVQSRFSHLEAFHAWAYIYGAVGDEENLVLKLQLCLDHFPFLKFSDIFGVDGNRPMVPDVPSLQELCRSATEW